MWFANYEQGITLPLKLKKAEVSGKNCSIDGSKLKLGKKRKRDQDWNNYWLHLFKITTLKNVYKYMLFTLAPGL